MNTSVSPPSHTLQELVEESGLTKHQFARRCGIGQHVFWGLYYGIVSITPEHAEKFGNKGYGTKEFWLKRVKRYEDWKEKENATHE